MKPLSDTSDNPGETGPRGKVEPGSVPPSGRFARLRQTLRPLGRGWFNLAVIGIAQVGLYLWFVHTDAVQLHLFWLPLLELIGATVLFFAFLNSVLALVPWRRVRAGLNLSVMWSFSVLLMYRVAQGAALDFGLLVTNMAELVSPDGCMTVLDNGGVFGWSFLALIAVGGLFAESRWRALSTVPAFPGFSHCLVAALVLLAANAGVYLSTARYPNEAIVFARSAIRFFKMPDLEAASLAGDDDSGYPLVREFVPSRPLYGASERPHVFVVLMESFSTPFIEVDTPDGRPVTPFFNSLIAKGQYHELFFSNSMQTERGHSGTTCSIIPSYRKKIMRAYHGNNLRCIPAVMRDNDYVTVFSQATPDLSFDNTGPFMSQVGFEHVIAMDDQFVGEDEKPFVWGWGLQDDIFFAKTLGYLDRLEAGKPDGRYYVQLATISNHMRFDWMPQDQKHLYPEPSTFIEKFHNSMYLADSYLKRLFQEIQERPYLKDRTLVLLLGDHGFPSGRHGSVSNEVGFYDELFRVPFLAVGPGLEPWRNRTVAYSQLDLAPTILEWLGIGGTVAFAGEPMPWSPEDLPGEQHVIPLIQPYDGGYLMSLRWPWKYGRSLGSDEEFLFNLEADPDEAHDIWRQDMDPELREGFRRSVLPIFRSQRLLDQNRIFTH